MCMPIVIHKDRKGRGATAIEVFSLAARPSNHGEDFRLFGCKLGIQLRNLAHQTSNGFRSSRAAENQNYIALASKIGHPNPRSLRGKQGKVRNTFTYQRSG